MSNETDFVHTIRLMESSGGAYIGVGPEQNFSFVARLRPEIAFIIDIRQENRNLHLMYKALFELSADRCDFLSRLFSRERPHGLGTRSSIEEIVAQYQNTAPSRTLRDSTWLAIRQRLIQTHKFPLAADDLAWIEYAFNAFYTDGPGIQYARSRPNSAPGPTYGFLMAATDIWGEPRSYLASEDGFEFLKQLQQRNLIVPVVGDFAGPKAIRLAGDYVRSHGSSVEGFYSSNVEVYLDREQTTAFCRNLSSLPHSRRSWFIGSKALRPLSGKIAACEPKAQSLKPEA